MAKSRLDKVRDHPVRTQVDLENLWRALMGEGGFGRRSLWLAFLNADGRPIPTIVPIDDVPLHPDQRSIRGLRSIVEHLTSDESAGSVVMLLSRPGPAIKQPADRAWARALAPLSPWPIHLATADLVQVFAPDDLLANAG